MKIKLNSVSVGLLLGLLAPVLSIYLFYFFSNPSLSFQDYFDHLLRFKLISHLISIGAISNLLVFFLFIWTNKLFAARGVLFATVVYAIFVAIAKII